ncbi:transcription elongation regulator 1-like protein [Bombina bombina]|uniref:transcription elongation regulator 1-like protein n=1 Tax=Bombina bombina TaxID=8345 RepID=UPI00235B00B5|nr:transcription elongation regulator 1-like protein [Bombina bombina]
MFPISRIKRQPIFWPMNAEPPPWICMIPETPGVFRIGAVPPPFILSCSPPSPLLQGVPAWQIPCDPFLPLMSVSPAPEPAAHQFPLSNGQWIDSHSPPLGFSPSSSTDLFPLFPHIYSSTVPPYTEKCWIEKKMSNCKIFLNNCFTLDSSWMHPPEELILLQGFEKPNRRTSQVTMAISRPTTTARPLHTVILTPQRMTGTYQGGVKQAGTNQAITLVGAVAPPPTTLMAVESEASHGLSSPSLQTCHMLTLSPIKIPFIGPHLPGGPSRIESHMTPLLPTQFARLTTSPSVTFMTASLVDPPSNDKRTETNRTSCSAALILHSERKNIPAKTDEKDYSVKLGNDEDGTTNGNKPVASTPVPGSPWCVVWTGDDRVFFFNPTIQLSVWDKPIDLKNRMDINKIIEDPPHKRKLESSPTSKKDGFVPEENNDEHNTKTKRNKTEDPRIPDQGNVDGEEKNEKSPSPEVLPPLEERMTCFRSMLLERGVSAFSTWEKELHKIVFDPRYLVLNSDERKQVFDQFVKTRIKEEYKEKRTKLMLAKEEFKKLLEESKVSPRTTFKEFAEKYGRDQRFRIVQKKKDQEHFFNQFINLLKKRDKENRMRLRKMR